MIFGIIRERKQPPDFRTPFSPESCKELVNKFPEINIIIESSPDRCFSDQDYIDAGFEVLNDISHADVLLGIKEIPAEYLIPNKTYLFFSHTIKKQAHNRNMLRAILKNNIRLIDYECLTWENGSRIIGFGRFAGIVGTYNGLLTWGKKTNSFTLSPAYKLGSYDKMKAALNNISLSPIKIALCGDGRVAHGALELLEAKGIREVTKQEFLYSSFDEPVFVHLRSEDYYSRKDGKLWDKSDFYQHPQEYKSTFLPYAQVCDMMINAIYWDAKIPIFFTREEMKSSRFKIKVIADITCDVDGAIPATIRSTSIEDPVFGWHAVAEKETEAFLPHTIDIMAVGNLPCELPADASEEFGENLLRYVIPYLIYDSNNPIINRATICEKGQLTEKYQYLKDYVD